MPIRWRCPPENSCGYRLRVLGRQADQLEQLAAPGPDRRLAVAAVDLERLGDDRLHRSSAGSARRTGPGRRSAGRWRSRRSLRRRSSMATSSPWNSTVPPVGSISRSDASARGRLPAARLPHHAQRLTGPQLERHRTPPAPRRPAPEDPAGGTGNFLTRSRTSSDGPAGPVRPGRHLGFDLGHVPISAVPTVPAVGLDDVGSAVVDGHQLGLAVAGRDVVGAVVPAQRRLHLGAHRGRHRAAGWNGHPGGRSISDGGTPLMGVQRRVPSSSSRGSDASRPERVRHPRVVEDLVDGAALDDPPGVHHDDPVGRCRRPRRGRG